MVGLRWLRTHKHIWRVLVWSCLLVALISPWAFDRIYIPAQYPCSFRLEDDFCGRPLSGIMIFYMISWTLIDMIPQVTGPERNWAAVLRPFLFLLVLLPIFTTPLVILWGDRQPGQLIQIITCGVGVSIGLLLLILSDFSQYWSLWGARLYLGLLAGALFLELLTLDVVKNLWLPRRR